MATLINCVRRYSLRQIIVIALIGVMNPLLVPPSSAATLLQTADKSVHAGGSQILAWLTSTLGVLASQATGGGNRNRKGVRPDPPLSQAEREARVAAIELNVMGEIVLISRQSLVLSAIPSDQDGRTIHGIRAKWDSSNKRVIFIRKSGEAVAGMPGEATITARVGSKTATVRVRVVAGTNEPFGGKKHVDSTRKSQQQAVRQATRLNDNTLIAQKMTPQQKRAHAVRKLAGLPGVMPFIRAPNDDPLPDNETSSLYQTNNLIGTPPGKKKPGALTVGSSVPAIENGNRNFSFGLPIVSMAGRGIDVSLGLKYNSLVWNKSTNPSDSSTWMTYDVDSGYPAQGFRLGYGQIEDQGSAGFTLTDADGTRHALVFSSTYNYDTNDGTFIHFTGGSGLGTIFYPEGTQVTYGAAGNGYRSYPTSITDRNGNYILISYVNGVGPRINTIQDTLGRYVRFYYDSNNDLVTITMPGLTGQSDLQVMRFYYDTLTLPSGLFASGINVDKPSTARVLKYVYLPVSSEGSSSSSGDLGYRFDYSAYGMIYQIVKFQGMTASTTSTSSTGTVSEGSNTIAATTTYDYYTSASGLSDVPTFAHRTDEWAGRTGGGSAPQYTFAVSEESTETTSTVTAPDGTVSVTLAIKNSGVWDDGLIKETRIQNGSSVVFSRTAFAWEQNSTNLTPRIASIKVTNESGKTKATVFTYDSNTVFNNVFRVSERDFTSDGSISSTELRKTETSYVTSSNYLSRRLLHLPSSVQIFAGGASTPASRVDYAYDDYGTSHADLTSRDDIIMHDPAFDPFQEPQEGWDWVCTEWGYNESGYYDCLHWDWQMIYYYDPYDSTTDYRGNVTGVITYPDTSNTANTITHSRKYDIAGNVIVEDVDCCHTQSFTYSSVNNDYAYPVSITKGNPGGLHLTSSIAYDMNTGLVASTTDPNSRVTYFAYNTDSLRTDHIDFADGGQLSYDYGNALAADSAGRYHSNVVTTSKLDSTRYVDSQSYFDGRGGLTQTYRSYTSGDGWSITDTEYDSMGRAYRVSNPYYCTSSYGACPLNPSGIWTTRAFDVLGRTTQITMPRGDDANPSYTTTVQTTYEGEVTTVTDQANKQRRLVTDALGRLIKMHEPTSAGLGTVGSPNQETTYMYDVLDNLVKITQDSQTRFFKYDSLSRLIREKTAEQSANSSYNLSDALTGNSSWSRKLEYNSSGLLTRTNDARGVQADYSYDGLNRLTLIDYSDSTPDARYYYDSPNASERRANIQPWLC